MTPQNLELLEEVTWEDEVLVEWTRLEVGNESWEQFAKEVKGWSSRAEWRAYQFALLTPEKRLWKKYKVTKPNNTFPQFYPGPFQGWQAQCSKPLQTTYQELVQQKPLWVEENSGIQRFQNSLDASYYWGVYFPHNDRIYLMDGSHRCAKIAQALENGTPLTFNGDQILYLTELSEPEFNLLEETLQRGSHNPDKKS